MMSRVSVSHAGELLAGRCCLMASVEVILDRFLIAG